MDIDFGFEDDFTLNKKKNSHEAKHFNPSYQPKKSGIQLKVIAEETNPNNQKETIAMSEDVINSEEFQKIVSDGDHLNSPSSKISTIKPLYFNCGSKLHKATIPEKTSSLSQKLLEDDDICVNGENSEADVINSRLDLLEHSFEEPKSGPNALTQTISHSQKRY